MSNLYGYKEEDIKGLLDFIEKNKNKHLSTIFKEYALKIGKASGTIRNLYYAIVKSSNLDESFAKEYCNGDKLKVLKKQEFSKEEERKLVENILRGKNKGLSVRKCIFNMANGDDKLALRLQNKFRIILKKDQSLIDEVEKELHQSEGVKLNLINSSKGQVNELQFFRLKKEIDNLVNNISSKIRCENEMLKKKVAFLTEENLKLNQMLFNSINMGGKTISYFAPLNERKAHK